MQGVKIGFKTNIFLLIVLAVSLSFFCSFLFPFSGIWAGSVRNNLANIVGVSAGVPTNPYNTLNKQLEDKKNELDKREKAIADYELFLSSQVGDAELINGVAVAGASASGILFALVGMNFFWDYKRNKIKIKNS